ncbi:MULTISPECIES: heme biosynthesis protein HemY [Pseudomonas]|jgi:HemY protein|uniref:heme biosynthesis protein HemY n=1 Tax=Pseudomonas TaxID=286 RepID=UPI000488DBB1|nr:MULTISPECIES: heme biosynthesis protein HemY [Pseudomonas]PRA59930.1 heme biosynthesis protein HemY [Pseudomonas sp. MYb115]QXN50170.1 heme biosynthesis protein HemY [Pseudomonas fluorescens]WSO24489.1 heme biosynthesis protein HemY [Pseudomonas fluorescens]
MKRLYIIVFLVIAAAGALGLAIAQHAGYVLIAYNSFRYESSLWATLLLLAVIWLVLWGVKALIELVAVSSGVVNPWSNRNRSRRVQVAIEHGQLDLAEGRWASAQRHLQRAAEAERQPLLYYLGAARAANEQGRYEECDNLLERALERQPQAELAIALSHAQLQTDRGDTDGALTTLVAMHERHPHSVQVLRQLQRLHQQRGDWSSVIRLLPELRKDKALPASELAELERRAWGENLSLAAHRDDSGAVGLQSLNRAWQQLTSAQRQEPQLVLAYAEQLRQLGAEVEAEEVLRTALKRHYDSHLARLYGLLRGSDPARQLQTAEAWLKDHPNDPSLLLTLGRLCLQTSLWGKARDYLESSLRLQRNPEACAELARLLAQLGDTERSNQLFQEGLGLLDERLLASPLPVPARV